MYRDVLFLFHQVKPQSRVFVLPLLLIVRLRRNQRSPEALQSALKQHVALGTHSCQCESLVSHHRTSTLPGLWQVRFFQPRLFRETKTSQWGGFHRTARYGFFVLLPPLHVLLHPGLRPVYAVLPQFEVVFVFRFAASCLPGCLSIGILPRQYLQRLPLLVPTFYHPFHIPEVLQPPVLIALLF